MISRLWSITAVALLAACVGVVADALAAPAGKPADSAARVEVRDNFFDPHSVTISKGQTVRWVWKGEGHHNVVFKKVPAGASKRRIKTRSAGQVSRKFPVAGNYRYVCTLYDGMEGALTVTP